MKWLPLIFLTLAFAGCSDDPATTESPDSEDHDFQRSELQAPTWAIGDVWEYQTSNGIIKLAVSDDAGDYTLDTNDTRIAFFDEQFDISYVGTMTRANLAGAQGGTPVQFFDFPLYDNKTWTTSWDGEQLQLVASETSDEVYYIQALRDGVMVNEYQYSNATRFFDWISFTDGEGNENYRMDLISRGTNWSGQLIRLQSEAIQQITAGGIGLYNMEPVDADVFLQLQYACTTGAFSVAIGPIESASSIVLPADTDGFSDSGQCPATGAFSGIISTTPEEGNWGHAVAGVETIAGTVWLREYERIDL